MTETKNDFDSPWKDVLEAYFSHFLEFFFPDIYRDIDWSQSHEFLDTELQQIVRDAELGKRFADRLVKVWRLSGEECWVLIHIEVQQNRDANFAERMYVYNYRIRDRYDHSVVSLAVLTDDSKTWRPQLFESQLWGCRVNFQFPIVKLIDYNQDWPRLEESLNPFSTIAMAHLKAIETRHNDSLRQDWKFRLSRRLYEKGYERQDILNLFRFIDWIILLPQELETDFRNAFANYEREKDMPYITSIERMAKQEGLKEGLREGLLNGIQLNLNFKFGEEGKDLFSEISEIKDVETLKMLQAEILQATSPEEFKKLYLNL